MLFRRVRPALGRWGRSSDANVSIIFALSAVPMVLLMGAAVDYTRSVTKRTALQQATDATALAVAHDLAQNLPAATINSDAQNYFAAAMGDPKAWIASGPTVSTDKTQVCLTTRDTVQAMIMQIANGAGFSTTVAATSCAKINTTTFEIALALDNSTSMLESTSGTTKLASLQSASTQLLAIMDPPGQVPRTSFALAPFASNVNVGAGFKGASWLDMSGQSSIHWQNFQMPLASKYANLWLPTSKFDLFSLSGQTWAGCVEERPAPYMTSDDPASSATPDTLFVPYLWPDEAVSTGSGGSKKYGINNYFNSTSAGDCSSQGTTQSNAYTNADAGNTITVTNNVANTLRADGQTKVCKYNGQSINGQNSLYGSGSPAGANLLCSRSPVKTLTNDTTVLTTAINAMVAYGDTNLVGGFMWAWRTISPNGPFGGQPTTSLGNQNPKPYGTTGNQKVIIMMTDGFNAWGNWPGQMTNTSAYSSFGYFANARLGATDSSNYRTLMDNATQQACTNAKAAGIMVYTVGFSIPSDPIDSQGLTLLQNCASMPSMAYIAQDGTSLIATFKAIGANLSGLRLTN